MVSDSFAELPQLVVESLPAHFPAVQRPFELGRVVLVASHNDRQRKDWLQRLAAQPMWEARLMAAGGDASTKWAEVALATELMQAAHSRQHGEVVVPVLGSAHFMPALQQMQGAGAQICLASFSRHCSRVLSEDTQRCTNADVIWLDQILNQREPQEEASPESLKVAWSNAKECIVGCLRESAEGQVSLRDIGRHLSQHQEHRNLVRRHGGLVKFLMRHCKDEIAMVQGTKTTTHYGAMDAMVTLLGEQPERASLDQAVDSVAAVAEAGATEAAPVERSSRSDFWEQATSGQPQPKKTTDDVEDDVWNEMQQVLSGKKLRPSDEILEKMRDSVTRSPDR